MSGREPVRILHIEPSDGDHRYLGIVLEEMRVPHRMIRIASAVEALSILRPQTDILIDVVILNWRLPYMDTSEAIERLRAIPGLLHVPVVVTITDQYEAQPAIGATAFIEKPIDAQKMRAILDLVGNVADVQMTTVS